ncbi:hypothetical protein BJ875DRAFT_506186 [Amylocarpus encephaloides]|uniref:Rhodanese domain-containing protein n=1 Tax=Amylocarpus encephaloides TaxID=45428 RepID=A0A9P8C351_9HELO|nr:hypothetical protein BJ875DRAFT_506186 [Amylocarpus encephaloides]
MGVTNYSPKNWDSIEVLSPAEFHARCYSEPNALLLDVRNYYESRIGYFINPKTGQPALRPPIRRFSQWPQYVTKYMTRSNDDGAPGEEPREARQILTFCTGGIRCEKGARYMQENMSRQPADKVATLQGGIAAYLSWINEEVKQGRKKPSDSLFKGRNFVFDARGSTALDEPLEPVSKCHECERASDRLSKCRSQGCHLVLVICPLCEVSKDPRCCQSCLDMHPQNAENESPPEKVPSAICKCEKERERQLWGEGSRKLPRALKKKRDESSTTGKVDIRAKLIC